MSFPSSSAFGNTTPQSHYPTSDALPTRPVGHPAATGISARLHLGGIWDTFDRRLRISHLLLLTTGKWLEQIPARATHLEVLSLDIGVGMLDLRQALSEGVPFMQQAVQSGGAILVACGDEVGCSGCGPAVIAAHVALESQSKLSDAIEFMQRTRPFALVDPELSVVKQLAEWDAERPECISLDDLKTALGMIAPPAPSHVNTTAAAPIELSDEVIKHKNNIAENLLTLHCPECGMAFIDFTACFALWCACCNCAFCAYCQASCRSERNDAHAHVAKCHYNIAPRKSIFASKVTFEHSQNLRRVRALSDYMESITDSVLRSDVLEAITGDLKDLGMVVSPDGTIEAREPANLAASNRSNLHSGGSLGSSHGGSSSGGSSSLYGGQSRFDGSSYGRSSYGGSSYGGSSSTYGGSSYGGSRRQR